MTTAASAVSARRSVASVAVPAWAWLLLAFAVFAIYFLAQENGAS